MALFAATPVLLALPSGRLIDRLGYHRPVALATVLGMMGAGVAVGSTFLDGAAHFVLLCLSAMLAGAGTNLGMLAVQRAGGAWAADATERVRVFSWIGVAPAFSNMTGAVFVGVMFVVALVQHWFHWRRPS